MSTSSPQSGDNEKTSDSKGCLGCLGLIAIVFIMMLIAGGSAKDELKKDFAKNRDKIITDMSQAAKEGNHDKVVAIGERYEDIEDYDFKSLLNTAKEAISATGKNSRSSSKESKTAKIENLNSSFRLGDFSYTITGATKSRMLGLSMGLGMDAVIADAVQSAVQDKEGEVTHYLIVDYKIRNEGSEVDVVSTGDFKVMDSKGRNYSTSTEATERMANSRGLDALIKELQPGISAKGQQIFLLPDDSFDGKLLLVVPEKGFFSSGEVRVRLNM